MDFDFQAFLDGAAEMQAEQAARRAQDRAQPLRSVLKWAPRHARGSHSQSAQKRARKAQDWLVEKVHQVETEKFWEDTEKRLGLK